MPLGVEIDLGAGHIVFYGVPSPPERVTAPSFWPMSIVARRPPISATTEHLPNAYTVKSCSYAQFTFCIFMMQY